MYQGEISIERFAEIDDTETQYHVYDFSANPFTWNHNVMDLGSIVAPIQGLVCNGEKIRHVHTYHISDDGHPSIPNPSVGTNSGAAIRDSKNGKGNKGIVLGERNATSTQVSMLFRPPALLQRSVSRSFGAGKVLNSVRIRNLIPNFQESSSRPFSMTSEYKASEDLKGLEWPEENLTSTANEGGGFYPARVGETFDDGRFVVTRKLGWGGFSSVWLARDRKDDRHVALKILSSFASREIEAGRLGERDILRKVTNAAPSHQGFRHVIHLLHEFAFESFAGQHICFVTDVLSYSVRSLQNEMSDPRLPLEFALRVTKHVLKGLEYLHDECNVIHSDLKPGNILLLPSDLNTIVMRELAEQPSAFYEFPKTIPPSELPFHPIPSMPLLFALDDKSQDVKWHWVIADLGHAHLQHQHLSDIVQPYALRAPEVILGLEWGPAIDIWSLGCMMYEFATGHWLFTPEATDDLSRDVVHLAQMTQRTGQVHDEAALKQYGIQKKQPDLKDMLRRATAADAGIEPIESKINKSTVYGNSDEEIASFVRLMKSLLTLDPAKRPRAVEALRDPVFQHID